MIFFRTFGVFRHFAGVKDVTKDEPEKVFDCLEKLLWNHPSKVAVKCNGLAIITNVILNLIFPF